MTETITLHGSFLSAPTFKVGLMLTLTGRAFAYRHVDLSKGEHKSPGYLELNRFGQVPVLRHGGETVVQSNVILDYLVDVTGRFGGADAGERRQAREWLAWEADRLLTWVGRTRFFTRFMRPDPAVADYFRAQAGGGIQVIDDCLEGRDWLVGGEPTIADIGCHACLAYADEANIALDEWPNVAAWTARIRGLPGYLPPYELLPPNDRD